MVWLNFLLTKFLARGIYSVCSWFFLINLMKTSIGWRVEILFTSVFFTIVWSVFAVVFLTTFNSIFIFFDWLRSCLIQRCSTLIVHDITINVCLDLQKGTSWIFLATSTVSFEACSVLDDLFTVLFISFPASYHFP